jgi:hypothetical protein
MAVVTGSLDNAVTLAIYRQGLWHRVWAHRLTYGEILNLRSIHIATVPSAVYRLVTRPHWGYVPMAQPSSTPYWNVVPKARTLTMGQQLTSTGWIDALAGKTVILNWTAATSTVATTTWFAPVRKDGYFSITVKIPSSIGGNLAPTGAYTLTTGLPSKGDSQNRLQWWIGVRR